MAETIDESGLSKLELEALKRKERLKSLKRKADNTDGEESENDKTVK